MEAYSNFRLFYLRLVRKICRIRFLSRISCIFLFVYVFQRFLLQNGTYSENFVVDYISNVKGLRDVSGERNRPQSNAKSLCSANVLNAKHSWNNHTTAAYRHSPRCHQPPYMVIYIHSKPNHTNLRNHIRFSWGRKLSLEAASVKLVFVVGHTRIEKDMLEISMESHLFNDIVQANFEDSYRNLTIKNLYAMTWIQRHCSHAQFVLKADDDIYLNVTYIIHLIQRFSLKSSDLFFLGHATADDRPQRSITERWFVPMQTYNLDLFPPYCKGYMYLFTSVMIQELLECVGWMEDLFWIEDVFITGFLAERLGIRVFSVIADYRRSEYQDRYSCNNLKRPILTALGTGLLDGRISLCLST